MRKVVLVFGILISFLASEAQTTKKHSKKSKNSQVNSEALFQARQDSLVAKRQLGIDSAIAFQLKSDSLRKKNERIAEEKLQQERLAWKEIKQKEIDSMNKEQVKLLVLQQQQSAKIQEERNVVNKAAKLNDYQKQQVNFITRDFFVKAQKIKGDVSIPEDKKKQQLTKLNDERRDKLKTVIGKSKEKKFEKARKSRNNTNDTEGQWINEADGFAKN